MRTRGESLFAEYLTSRGIEFRYEPSLGHRGGPPDFAITWRGVDCYIDVKDRENVDDDAMFPDPLVSCVDDMIPEVQPPYSWLRKKIRKARAKFSGLKGSPCGLVVFAATGMSSDFEEPDFMIGSMLGDASMVVDESVATIVFGANGGMLAPNSRRARNTTISALITLRILPIGEARRRRLRRTSRDTGGIRLPDFDAAECQLGVIVWDSPVAVAPFPRDLFAGPFDERWSQDGDSMRRTFVGDGLAEYHEESGVDL